METSPSQTDSAGGLVAEEAPHLGRAVRRGRFFAVGAAVGLILAAALTLWLCRAPVLTGVARAWIVQDATPAHADAILVLSGDLKTRPDEAARLFLRGVAPKILVTAVEPSRAELLGLIPRQQELTISILEKDGVPLSAIEVIGRDVGSTKDEAEALAEWARLHAKARRVVVVTDVFHTRRALWIVARRLAGTGLTVSMVPAPPIEYTVDSWWQSETGLVDFQNEVVKYVYYRLKY